MRGLVFVVATALTLLVLALATEWSWAFAVLMSACVGALVCTATTAEGRRAARRIRANARVGWGRHA